MTPSLYLQKPEPEWRRKRSKPIRAMMIHMYPTLLSRHSHYFQIRVAWQSLAAFKHLQV